MNKLVIDNSSVKIISDFEISHYIDCETSIRFNNRDLVGVDGEIPEGIIEVWLEDNNLRDLRSLRFPCTVKTIFLANNLFSSTKNLCNLPDSVETLILNNNKIEEVDGENLPKNLKMLFLTGNRVKKMVNMDRLEKLERINLGVNGIEEIEQEWFSPNLEYIGLYTNRIKNISHIVWPSNSKSINLSTNKIENINGITLPDNLFDFSVKFNPLENVDLSSIKRNQTNIWT